MDTVPATPQSTVVKRTWRDDGPRFVLVGWAVSMVVIALAAFAAYVCVAVAATVRSALDGERSREQFQQIAEAAVGSPANAWASVIASQLALLACLWLFWRLLGKPQRERFGLVSISLRPLHQVILIVATVVPFALGLSLAWLVSLVLGEPDQSNNPLLRMWSQGSRAQSVLWTLLIALLPACTEEIFYRGFLQKGLLKKWGPAASIAISSLLFACAHFSPEWAAAILPLGVWLGIIAWRTGSVQLTFVMHACLNGIWTAMMMISHRNPAAEPWVNGVAIGLLTVGAISFCWAVVILRRGMPQPTSMRNSRLLPRVVITCVVAGAVLMLIIPDAPAPTSSPTFAQLEARATQAVSVTAAGDGGGVEFELKPGDVVRVNLPPNKAGVQHIVVSLDVNGKTVWLANSGELTGKGGKNRLRGSIDQLVSSAPTLLCLAFGEQDAPITVRATLEEDESRIAAAIRRADVEGWAKRMK